jgi:hypothetical protein
VLKFKCDGPLSNFAFKFNLHCYNKVRPVASAAVAAGAVLAIHTLDPVAAQYLQLALEGGWQELTLRTLLSST